MADFTFVSNYSSNAVSLADSYSTSSNNNKDLSSKVSKDSFKDVLSTKTKTSETKCNDNTKNTSKTASDNLKIKTDNKSETDTVKTDKFDKELESLNEKVDKISNDITDEELNSEVNDILTELLSALNQLIGTDNTDISKVNENTEALVQNLIEGISNNPVKENNDLQSILKMLTESTSNENVDADSLNKVKELLSNLSEKIPDNTEVQKSFKQDLESLVAKINENAISEEKLSTNLDTLNKNYSQNQENSSENSAQNSNSTLAENTKPSKEDKFLSSLLDTDGNSFENRINLFSNRVQPNNDAAIIVENKPVTVNAATFTDDLIQDVKFMSTNDLNELVVKVNPANLGKITIELVQEDGTMKANLKANSKETAALLSQSIAEIKKELGEQNIKIAEVNVELYQEDTTYFSSDNQFSSGRENGERRSQNTSRSSGSIEGEQIEEDSNEARIQSNLDFLA